MATPLRVLILEDVPDDAELMLLELREAGFDPTWHRVDIEAAYLDHLDQDWDVILADYTLTQFDALGALEVLKERGLDIPFIVVTGSISEEAAVACMKRGASDYLLKDRLARLGPAVQNALEEKQVREARRQAEDQLLLQTTALEAAANGVVITDREGTILWVNPAFTDLTGYSAREAIGQNPRLLKSDRQDHAFYQDLWETILSGRVWQGELINRARDGRLYPEEMTITPLKGSDGEITHFIAIKQDITARKQYEEALIQARDEAEEMNRLKDAFLANMSHDIRTPLSAIIGFADLIAMEVPESHRRHIHQIKTSGKRLLNTLNSVLDLSMLEAGTLELHLEVLDVVAEVQQIVQLLPPVARGKGLDLQMQFPASKVEAMLDRACLDRILTNLIGNAINFTERGEVTLVVRARAEQVEIEVSDTGIGISEAFMPYLFEAFKQESTGLTRSHEGTGLGLTITKQLIALMEGEITVESRKGEGSRFTVTFPRLATQPEAATKAPEAATKAPEAAPRHPAGKHSLWPARVLAVDDNPAMLYLLERFLEEMPEASEVDTAEDEESALALARRQRYDVVLLDINLGVIRTGVDVLQALRQLPEYAMVPAVAVTAYALPGDRERFLEAGFDAYLSKPFTEEQLRQVLIAVLLAQDSDRPHQSVKSVG